MSRTDTGINITYPVPSVSPESSSAQPTVPVLTPSKIPISPQGRGTCFVEASFNDGKRGKTPNNQRTRAFLMRVINIEAVNLINVTENMGRRRGDLTGQDLKEQKEQEPW